MGAERWSSRAASDRARDGGPDTDDVVEPARGFRPSARRRRRLAVGVGLGAIAVAGNLAAYSSLDDRASVLQVVTDVPAGEELDQVLGQYAKVRMVAGALVVVESLQPAPLVEAGTSIVALQLPAGSLPVGLRERSSIQIVLPVRSTSVEVAPVGPIVVTGRVVGLPTVPDGVAGTVSLSVEVPNLDAPALAVGEGIRVVLLPPSEAALAEVADVAEVAVGEAEAAVAEDAVAEDAVTEDAVTEDAVTEAVGP